MPWDPKRYEQFRNERYQPFDDLVALLNVRDGLRVIDLGCGTGELTRRLADMLPDSDVLGVDSSAEMLARTQEFARDGLRYEQRPIEDVSGEYDLIFSNAALQWIDGHAELFARLFSLLAPGGQIVAQIPSNFRFVAHTTIADVAREDAFRDALGGYVREWPVLSNMEYAQLLYKIGGTEITCFEKIYPHVLEDADAVVDWLLGTALVPYMAKLSQDTREPFLQRYREVLRERLPGSPVLFPFPRILFAARKPS